MLRELSRSYLTIVKDLSRVMNRLKAVYRSLLNAEGGSVEFKAPEYDGTIGLGFYNGKFEFGANARYLFHGYTVLAGDEAIPFTLPTDVFDSSHYFSARGLGTTRANENTRVYAFAGMTSTGLAPDSSTRLPATALPAFSFTSASGTANFASFRATSFPTRRLPFRVSSGSPTSGSPEPWPAASAPTRSISPQASTSRPRDSPSKPAM
jgi:hypothetical protein